MGVFNEGIVLNDLWCWDIDAQLWTWLSGSSSMGQATVVETKTTGNSSSNIIGARVAHRMSANPTDGTLIVFGGSDGN